jgi:hypothetical protein
MPVKIDISAFDEPVSKQKGDIDISAFDEDVKKKSTPSGYSVTPLPSQDKLKLGQEVATVGYKSPLGKAIQKDKVEGSNIAGLYNTLVGSLSSLAGGSAYMADILAPAAPLPLNLRVANAQADRKKVADFIEQARSSKSSREFEQQQGQFDITPKEEGGVLSGLDWEDVKGLAFQAPKTILDMAAGGVTGGYSFFAQSVNDNAKDLEDNEQLSKLSDTQKVGYLFTQATAQAALEYFSIDKILKNTGLAKSIEKKIASEVVNEFAKKGVKATAKDIENEMFKKAAKLSSKIKNVGIKGLESSFVEGTTEGVQQAASDAIKLTTNKIAKNEVFNEEDINKNFWKNIVNNAVMGGVMGGVTGGGLQGLNSTDKAIRQEIANATGEKKFYVDDQEVTEKEFNQATGNKKVTTDLQHIQDQINQQVEEGNLTPEEAQAANITAQQYAEIAGKIPSTVSPDDKYKIIGGISQRNKLQQDLQTARDEMMQVDPIFRKEKQDQVDLIQAKIEETNNYLEGIASGKEPKYKERRGMYFKVDAEGEIPVSKETYDLANAIKKNDENQAKIQEAEPVQEVPVKPVIRTTGTVVPMEEIVGKPKVQVTEEVKPTEVKEEIKLEEPVTEIKPEVKSKLEAFKTKFAPKEKELTPEEQRRRDVGLRAAGTRKDIQEANKIQPTDERSAVLSWLSGGNKLNWEAINEAAGKRQGAELNVERDFNSEEVQSRDYAGKTKDEGMSINDAAHEIWENLKQQTKNENFSDEDVRNFLIDAVREHTSKKDAAKKLVQLFSEKPMNIEEQQAAYYERQGEEGQPTENIQIEGGFKPVEGVDEFAVKEQTTEELNAMQDIVADYVKDGVTALPDIKKAIAKELGYNTKALRQTVEDAYNNYTASKEAAPKEILKGISDRIGNKLTEMFPKTAQKPFIAKDGKSLYKKAADLGVNTVKFQKQDIPQKGISASDKNGIDNLRSIADKDKLSIIDDAQKMLNTLKSVLPNFDIIVHGNEDSYNKAMKDFNGQQGSAGNFSYSKNKEGVGRIDINLNKANKRTVAHEVTHGIMLKAFGDNTRLFKDFRDKISNVLKESTNKELNDFADRQGVYSKENTYEEYLAELTGMLANKEAKLSTNILQKIAAIINDIVSKITNGAFTPFENIKKTKQVVDFFNDISESIRKGKAIDIENIKTQEELKKQAKTELEGFDKVATQKLEDLGRIFGMDLGRPISKSQVPVTSIPENTPVANGFDVLKKKLGETSAKKIRENIPFALDYPKEFIDFITKTIPAKEDIPFIVQNMSARLDGLFRLSINKSIENVKEAQATPEELSSKAGYVFHRNEKPEDVMVFKKDFANGEVLCTYNDVEGRMYDNFVFWLRRKNAETVLHAEDLTQEYLQEGQSEGAILWREYLDNKGLKKEDGSYNIENLTASRQDPYGTSSMSVQIRKSNGSISIKNRYNHTVSNPDATFSNDLNNVVDGLHDAVYNIEGVPKEKKEMRLPEFIVRDDKDRYFKYDREIAGVYISKNGYKDNSGIHVIDKSTQKMLDNFLIDAKNKTAEAIAGSSRNLIDNINKITFDKDAIKIQSDRGSLNFTLVDGVPKKLNGDITVLPDKFLYVNESLTTVDLPSVTNIGKDFLWYNKSIDNINLPSVVNIDDEFLYSNAELKNIDLPKVVTIGNEFLRRNTNLENINIPSTMIIGSQFLQYSEKLKNIDLPNVEYIGYDFLYNNNELKTIDLPKLKTISDAFLYYNRGLENINIPLVTRVGSNFLWHNDVLENINIPLVQSIERGFLNSNDKIKKIDFPLLQNVGDEFLYHSNNLESVNLPLLENIGDEFLRRNTSLKTISLPLAESIGSRFMDYSNLESIDLPMVKEIGYNFLRNNQYIKIINFPMLTEAGSSFMDRNEIIESVELPSLKRTGEDFLSYAKNLKNINLTSAETIGNNFLKFNEKITTIDLPNAKYIGEDFMGYNHTLSSINLPKVEVIYSSFLHSNNLIKNIDFPLIKTIYTDFLSSNEILENINVPLIESIGNRFLSNAKSLISIDLPKVEYIGHTFIRMNESLEKINVPSVIGVGNYFLENNEMLKELKMPNLKYIGSDFLYWNNFMTNFEIPNVMRIGSDFLYHNKTLENIELPEEVEINKIGFLNDNPDLANKILHKQGGWDIVSKSQVPMFMANENGQDILGFTYDNKMYLNGEKLNPNTLIHEAGHIWTEWVKNNDTKIYEKGMNLVENSPYLTKAKNSKFYQEQAENLSTKEEKEAYFKHEALAMAIGDKGAQFVLESKKENFKNWLKTLWSKIKNLTGFKDLTEEEFQNLTFEEFTKKAVKEILGTENKLDKFEAMKSFRSKKNFVKDNLKYESNKKAIDELDFTESDLADIVKSNFDLSTFKNIKDAVQKRSAKKILQRQQGANGEAGGGRKRVEPRIQGEGIAGEGEGETTQPQGTTQIPEEIENVGLDNQDVSYVGITEADINDLRKSLGLPRYKGLPTETHSMLRDVAQEMIKKGVDVQSLYDKIRRGDALSNYENAFMAEYRAALDLELKNNPSQELLAKIREFANTFQVGASLAGKGLESLKIMKKLNEANTLSNFLLTRQEDKGYTLTPKMIAEEVAKFEKVQKAKTDLEESAKKDVEEQIKAEEGKQPKKSHEEFVKERKEALAAAREALKKLRSGEQGLMVSVPGLSELIAVAPHMNKYAKSLFAEGVSKLDDIVTEVHAEFSDLIEGLTKRDVLDVITGKHNVKTRTANEINAGLRLLRREAELLIKLEQVRKGEEEAKSESQMAEKSKRIQDLERKIKEVRELNKAKEYAEEGVYENSPSIDKKVLSDVEYNEKRQKFLDKKIKKLEEDLKNKNYDKEEKQTKQYYISKKTQAKMDKVIELEKALALERYNDQYKKLSKWEKAWDKAESIFNIKRIVQTSIDASIWFRQLAKLTLNPRKWDIAKKFISAGVQSVFSQKNYDRLMYGIHQAPDYKESIDDGIRYNELDAVDSKSQNEMYPKSFVFKIPIVRDLIISSQRIADASLNVARYELYNKYKKNLLSQGITRESDPKVYEEMAKLVMNSTGSGNMLKILETPAGKKVAGSAFYGARLMAANFNTLNPAYYVKMPKEVRAMAMKDLAAYTSTILATTLALAAAGGAVSMDPDDPEFLQVRFGDKVYDFTAGQAAYIRTFLRLVEAGYARAAKSKFEANEAGAFAAKSTLTFFRNKLAPNKAYLANAITGKNSIGQDFDPMELFHIYPMYADDAYKAAKEDGFISLFTVLMPNILGIGYASYYSDKSMKPVDEIIGRAQDSDEMNPESIKKGITKDEFKEFAKLRDKLISDKITELYQEGIFDEELGEQIPIKKAKPEQITKAIMSLKRQATGEAKAEFNADEEE